MANPTQLKTGAPAWTVRPIEASDALALQALYGPCVPPALQALIQESLQAFAGEAAGTARHVFALCEGPRVRGVAAVVDRMGMDQPRYCFRTGVVVHASVEMAMFNALQTLALGNDTTGATELLLPTLLAALSADGLTPLIQAMLWYVADVPQRFAPHLVCELPGIGERAVEAPFWRALGRHFYAGALPQDHDLFAGRERSAIGRLMPKHTLYSSFLGADAQASVGQVSPTALARRDALSSQGFRFRDHINLFDGGPIWEATLADLPSVSAALVSRARVVDRLDEQGTQVCCLRRQDRALGVVLSVPVRVVADTVELTQQCARLLGVEAGEYLRVLACR